MTLMRSRGCPLAAVSVSRLLSSVQGQPVLPAGAEGSSANLGQIMSLTNAEER